jgi:hypothetical protein
MGDVGQNNQINTLGSGPNWLYLLYNQLKQSPMINSENIKCDGLGFAPALSEQLTNRLLLAITARKLSPKWMMQESGQFEDFYKGNRYHDNNRLVRVIVSNAHCLLDGPTVEDYFSNLQEYYITLWVDEALRYSGSADWFYTFEKDYN